MLFIVAHCCVLIYMQLFAQINVNLSPLFDGCKENKRQWQRLDDLYKEGLITEPLDV